MVAIEYRELPIEEIDKIKPLWEKIKIHHYERATVFKADFEKVTFSERKRKISMGKKEVRIIVAQDGNTSQIVGYCLSSISQDDVGEVDSLYIEEKFRRLGIGKELMRRTLEWFNENGIQEIIIALALGNEEALPFYEQFGFAPRTYILKQKPV